MVDERTGTGFEDLAAALQPSLSIPSSTGEQLIILGNGFDLACGLKSKFFDFFEPRMQVIERRLSKDLPDDDSWVKALRSESITVWDLILYSRRSIAERGSRVNWSDVEAAISDVVQMRRDPDEDNWSEDAGEDLSPNEQVTVSTIWEYFHYIDNHPGVVWPRKYAKTRRLYIDESDAFELADYYQDVEFSLPNEPSERVGAFLNRSFPGVRNWNDAEIRDALFSELLSLERCFERYLNSEVAQEVNYSDNSSRLLEAIIAVDFIDLGHDETEVKVLSFNYTNPKIPEEFENEVLGIINIHGSLGGEVIFGADGTGCMGDPGLARFSKTYRLMRRKSVILRGVIAHPPSEGMLGSTETTAIKFYGHSLARADYSYFQTIFDIVDLYSGSTRLYFLYTQHSPTAREDLLRSITKLLDAYGATMDNRDHGKNLIHKLLLEDRLCIQEISMANSGNQE